MLATAFRLTSDWDPSGMYMCLWR